jgi:hypothetical protein
VLPVDDVPGVVDCMLLEVPDGVVADGVEVEPVGAVLVDGVPDVPVCACSPKAAANSAEAPQLINVMGFFMSFLLLHFLPVLPRVLRIYSRPAFAQLTAGAS